MSSDNNKPKPQQPFPIHSVSEMQLGTIAIFGADEDIIRPMAFKLISVSSQPNIPVFSRMNTKVPTNPEPADVEMMADMEDQDVEFTLRERHHLDKVFMIFRLVGLSPDQEKAYAFVNVRGDRCENLLRRIHDGRTFDVSEYSTLIQVGTGEIPPEIDAKLEQDYLFGASITNVRIFPPLNEVT